MRAATFDSSTSALDALASLARRTSSARLVGVEIVGLVAALAIAAAFPDVPTFALPFVGIGMFGLWGAADRFRDADQHVMQTWVRWSLSLVKIFAATIGLTAVVAVFYLIVGKLIGTLIS